MILPNKVTRFEDCILSKIPKLLETVKRKNNIIDVWRELECYFNDINEYMLTIDIAYILGAIKYIEDRQEIIYVETNKL